MLRSIKMLIQNWNVNVMSEASNYLVQPKWHLTSGQACNLVYSFFET